MEAFQTRWKNRIATPRPNLLHYRASMGRMDCLPCVGKTGRLGRVAEVSRCHPERREGSGVSSDEVLRFAQDDSFRHW
jgi:hypothetical protein